MQKKSYDIVVKVVMVDEERVQKQKKARRRGKSTEYYVRDFLKEVFSVRCERVPVSGAGRGFPGDLVLFTEEDGKDVKFIFELKGREGGKGFSFLQKIFEKVEEITERIMEIDKVSSLSAKGKIIKKEKVFKPIIVLEFKNFVFLLLRKKKDVIELIWEEKEWKRWREKRVWEWLKDIEEKVEKIGNTFSKEREKSGRRGGKRVGSGLILKKYSKGKKISEIYIIFRKSEWNFFRKTVFDRVFPRRKFYLTVNSNLLLTK